jgi:hypothetical protein
VILAMQRSAKPYFLNLPFLCYKHGIVQINNKDVHISKYVKMPEFWGFTQKNTYE